MYVFGAGEGVAEMASVQQNLGCYRGACYRAKAENDSSEQGQHESRLRVDCSVNKVECLKLEDQSL